MESGWSGKTAGLGPSIPKALSENGFTSDHGYSVEKLPSSPKSTTQS